MANDARQLSQQMLFPINDPDTAFNNALRQSGFNPNAANPFMQMLKNSAGGARIAFLGNNVNNRDNVTNPSEAYGNWLSSAIRGGNLMGQMQNTARNIYGVTGGLNQFVDQLGSGNGNPAGVSPYAAALRDIFESDNGMGAMNAYASLVTPGMGRGIDRSYAGALRARGETGQYNFARQGSMQGNIWDWILGSGPSRGF